jgi:acetyl esterase/lipase
LAAVSFLMARLILMPAPSMLCLKLKVVATEYGYALAAPIMVLLRAARRAPGSNGVVDRLASGLALFGAGLMLVPLVRAVVFAKAMQLRLGKVCGTEAVEKIAWRPVSPRRLVSLLPAQLIASLLKPRRLGDETVIFYDDEDCRVSFDLFRPSGRTEGGAPCVIVIHGGKWTEGDSRDFMALSPYLAGRGYAVVSVNYRKEPFPAAKEDIEAALDYVKGHADELGVDAGSVALLGRSAGGQIALLVAYARRDPAIKAAISFYGPTDLRFGYADLTDPRVIDNRKTLERHLGGDPGVAGKRYDEASPIKSVSEDSPPTLLLHGVQDEVVHAVQSERLALELKKFGVRHLNLRLPWATHGFDHNLGGPSGQISTYAVEVFLEATLRRPEVVTATTG